MAHLNAVEDANDILPNNRFQLWPSETRRYIDGVYLVLLSLRPVVWATNG